MSSKSINQLYELREKSKVLARIIFTIRDGDIILLAPFIKRQPRDTMKALEQSLKMLADIRDAPEFAVNIEMGGISVKTMKIIGLATAAAAALLAACAVLFKEDVCMKKCVPLIALALAFAMSTGAFAMEVPTDTVVQNLNGSQQVIKTFTVAPDEDPQTLIEEPFELEGYLYTFKDITKVENLIDDTKRYTEVVTVETTDDDLSVILEKLMPTIEYDDGQYHGTLTLDHTSLYTEATSYSTRSYTVSETKTIGQLDRNDMSYVPATTVKNGVTLSLADVDWQVTGTDLVGEVLAPSSYQAVATYSGKAYYTAADGYVTTAEYVGEIRREGIEDITYTVTYLGEPVLPSYEDEANGEGWASKLKGAWPYLAGGSCFLAAGVLGTLLWRSRRQVKLLREAQDTLQEDDFEEREEDQGE